MVEKPFYLKDTNTHCFVMLKSFPKYSSHGNFVFSFSSKWFCKRNIEETYRGLDCWMASLTQWTWVWVNSRSWRWTGRPGVLQSMGSQRVGHDLVTELNWTEPNRFCSQVKRSLWGTLAYLLRIHWENNLYLTIPRNVLHAYKVQGPLPALILVSLQGMLIAWKGR